MPQHAVSVMHSKIREWKDRGNGAQISLDILLKNAAVRVYGSYHESGNVFIFLVINIILLCHSVDMSLDFIVPCSY